MVDPSSARPFRPTSVVAVAVLSLLAACSGGGSVSGNSGQSTVHPELLRVEYGRLVDVYGLQVTPQGSTIALAKRDVLIGGDIQDERGVNSTKGDEEVTYDFISADPETLQPRLFIPRDMTGQEFADALDAVDDNVREIPPMLFGTNAPGLPFGVMPRNAAMRLTFSAPLGVDDGFFVERDPATGQITGLRNTQAVQLLRITGDPEVPGNLSPLPVRIVPQDDQLILDPVLLGSEGLQYQTRNNASGLPEAPDQVGANIRIALALDGPLAIPGLRSRLGLTGLNNEGRQAIVRDFRSGNRNDQSADISNGFVRDPLPLRVVGEIVMYLESVRQVNEFTQEVRIYKGGKTHEIDRGDVFRFIADSTGVAFGSADVVVDPPGDQGNPGEQHVDVMVRNIPNLESIDPSNLPGYPTSSQSELEEWLVLNAPKAVCVAEFAAGDGGVTSGDDPTNFLTFTPEPLLNLDGTPSLPNENVSPFAGAIVRFTKPVAMESVKWADTFFFAMRDLTSAASIQDFILNRPNRDGGTGMEPAAFNEAKYRTPYLVGARVFDEDNSSTALRLQPSNGLFLNEQMRVSPSQEHRYYLHLIANSADGGIRDLAGNPVDLQGTDVEHNNSVVIPFTVDTRKNGSTPFFEDNLTVSFVHRFADRDEDMQPSYFIPAEVPPPGVTGMAEAYPLEDLFGGFVYVSGKLQARPTTRNRVVADNINQAPVASQSSILRWCPVSVGGENQVASNSATTLFGAGIQNPLNPYGCRLQMLWREVDLSLSRTDPFEFNLDIEQMYWAPFTAGVLVFDEFDRTSMFLGHCEYRPAPCVGSFSSLPSLTESGLSSVFQKNFVWNPVPTGSGTQIETQPTPHPAYVDQPLTIDPAQVVYEINGVNRFLPLPEFQKPYFVFRDETVVEQGGHVGEGTDTGTSNSVTPYIVSPYNNGIGRRWLSDAGGQTVLANSFWNDLPNKQLGSNAADNFTGGLVGAVALPLLADFWTYCDSAQLPAGNGYVALGFNGWQVALTVQSSPQPNFRAYSAGRAAVGTQPPICRGPGDAQWNTAQGGYTNTGAPTPSRDNTFYWIMMDVLKRQSVITNGFIDLNNPHRVPEGFSDPRLGPFYLSNGNSTRPANIVPTFAFEFDPPLSELPGGTSIVAQFRAAGPVDPLPWYWDSWVNGGSNLYPSNQFPSAMQTQMRPDTNSFPLDPFIAGDAHIRKWDVRGNRNWWSYLYNRTVTGYVDDPNDLMDANYLAQFGSPNAGFTPQDVRYVNWRLVTSNNVDANPTIAPSIETFSLSWRYQQQ